MIVSGPLPMLNSLSVDDLRVVIDLEGLDSGAHQLIPLIEILNEEIKVESILPESIEITIQEAPLTTPTAQP